MLFCKPIRNKSRFKPFREIDKTYSFTEYDRASLVNKADWEAVVTKTSIFLNLEYLKLVEHSTHAVLKCRYVIIYKNKEACAILYFQLTEFKANVFGDLLSGEINDIKSHRMKLFEKYVESKDEEDVLFRLFTCGNNLISGEYGFQRTEKISKKDFYTLFTTLLKTISSEESLGSKIAAVLVKDFETPIEELEGNSKFESFNVEPNLVVEIPEGLKSLEDYLLPFSKKYRNRAKSILKNRSEFEIKYMELSEIEKHTERIYSLYHNIYAKAKFKLLLLPHNYFAETKKIFPDRFFMRGFYSGDELIAFSSWFIMPDKTIEAHYIGMDYEMNSKLELYQNILYSFIELAIETGNHKVNLGRTAAEIKTTVGAKAHDLTCYVQPQNTLSKLICKPFIQFLKPKEWIPRNPFKEENLV
jgi:hypothetical protein